MKHATTQQMLMMAAGAAMMLSPDLAAQTDIRSDVIGCGGMPMTGNGRVMVGTVGQPAIGPVASATMNDGQGFWYGAAQDAGPAGVAVTESSNRVLVIVPNPVATSGAILLTLTSRRPMTLRLFDMLGREVAALLDGVYGPGTEKISFDAGHLPTGRYTLVLEGTGEPVHADLMIVR